MTSVQSRQMLRGGADARYAPSRPGSPTVDDQPAEDEVAPRFFQPRFLNSGLTEVAQKRVMIGVAASAPPYLGSPL